MNGQTRREMLRATAAGMAGVIGAGGLLTGGDVARAAAVPTPIAIPAPERKLWRLEFLEGRPICRDVEFWSHTGALEAVHLFCLIRGGCEFGWLTINRHDGFEVSIVSTGPDDNDEDTRLRVTEVPAVTVLWLRGGDEHDSIVLPARKWAAFRHGYWPLSESAG